MKLKYFIKSIDSTAEDIYVKSYGQNVFEFHKKDFDNDWINIINKKYELDPCLAADLDKLKMFGNEDHEVHFSHKDKVNWFEFARNKLRDDLFDVSERIADIDLEKPVEIYNKNKINNLKDFVTTVNKIPSSIKYIDLSTMNIADNFEESSESSDGKLTYDGYSISRDWLSSNKEYIIKMPQLPKNLTLASGLFYEFTSLSDISNLDFSNILEIKDYMFYNTKISDFSTLNLDNLQNISKTVICGCNVIQKVTLDFKKLKQASGYFISNCSPSTPFEVDKIYTPSDALITDSLIYYSNVSKIGEIEIGTIDSSSESSSLCVLHVESLKEIGNIKISKTVSANKYSVIFTNSSSGLESVGDITIGLIKNGFNLGMYTGNIGNISVCGDIDKYNCNCTLGGGSTNIGNIDIKSVKSDNTTTNYNFRVSLGGESIGVVNVDEYVKLQSISTIKIKACPMAYCNYNQTPTSSGFLWWCDSINKLDTDYTKNITKYYMDISMHFCTPDKHFVKEIDISDYLLKVNPDYPYDFKLKSLKVNTEFSDFSLNGENAYLTLTDVQSADIKVLTVSGKDNSVKLSFDIETVKDTSVIKLNNISTGKYLIYEAEIDGAPFTGKVPIILSGDISFEVTEDISSDFQVEYEEGETPIEPEEETTETEATE